MGCPICGENGHKAKKCPQNPDNIVRDRAFIVRVDNLTKNEQNKLTESIKKEKNKIAPDARGTIVSGSSKQLPYQPIKKLKPEDEDD